LYDKVNVIHCFFQTTPANSLAVTIVAEDRGVPSLTSTTGLSVFLTDINDFAPMFSQEEYATTTLSTALIGTSLLQVVATDQDGQDNQISYSIYNNSGFFSISLDGTIENEELFPTVPDAEVGIIFLRNKLY